jgi:hypothetical protein
MTNGLLPLWMKELYSIRKLILSGDEFIINQGVEKVT